MIWSPAPLRGPEGGGTPPVISGGILVEQGLRSWLTGGCSPALRTGFHGAGSATSDTAAPGGLFSVKRPSRKTRVVAGAGGRASSGCRGYRERPARRYARVVTNPAFGSSGFSKSNRTVTKPQRRSGRLCGVTKLGSVASNLQSARRPQRCGSRVDETRSAHFKRAGLRSPLCQHALRQRVLHACASLREAPALRYFCLRAIP